MRFELAWHERRVGPQQTPRRFLDYLAHGESLYDRHRLDFISCLGWLLPEADEQSARRLLGESPPDVDGRVAIYICPEDADLLCGAISVLLIRDGDAVVWGDPASSYYDHMTASWEHDRLPFADWPELRFDADDYAAAITRRPPAVLL